MFLLALRPSDHSGHWSRRSVHMHVYQVTIHVLSVLCPPYVCLFVHFFSFLFPLTFLVHSPAKSKIYKERTHLEVTWTIFCNRTTISGSFRTQHLRTKFCNLGLQFLAHHRNNVFTINSPMYKSFFTDEPEIAAPCCKMKSMGRQFPHADKLFDCGRYIN